MILFDQFLDHDDRCSATSILLHVVTDDSNLLVITIAVVGRALHGFRLVEKGPKGKQRFDGMNTLKVVEIGRDVENPCQVLYIRRNLTPRDGSRLDPQYLLSFASFVSSKNGVLAKSWSAAEPVEATVRAAAAMPGAQKLLTATKAKPRRLVVSFAAATRGCGQGSR
jgi:hypothetical protein